MDTLTGTSREAPPAVKPDWVPWEALLPSVPARPRRWVWVHRAPQGAMGCLGNPRVDHQWAPALVSSPPCSPSPAPSRLWGTFPSKASDSEGLLCLQRPRPDSCGRSSPSGTQRAAQSWNVTRGGPGPAAGEGGGPSVCWGEWAGTLSVPGGLRGGPQCARGGAVHGDPQYVRGVERCMGILSMSGGAVHGDPQYVRGGGGAWGPSVCPWEVVHGDSQCTGGTVHGDPRCARGGRCMGTLGVPGGAVHGGPQCVRGGAWGPSVCREGSRQGPSVCGSTSGSSSGTGGAGG